jgi:hypothetical protein
MYDLSIVTDALREILVDALATSPLFAPTGPGFSVGVSGQRPEMMSDSDCDLNLYLFHMTENRFLKNSFWSQSSITGQPPGPPRQPVAFEPQCLDLFFLLSAQSAKGYVQEQQVMSVAVRALHEHAMVTLATAAGDLTSRITLTMESPSCDELSRIWQGLNVPMRMTARYRAGVVLMTPQEGLTEHPKPTTWTLTSAPADAGSPALPLLYGTSRHVTFVSAASGAPRTFDQTPASTAPAPAAVAGQEILLRGRGLREGDQVFLVVAQPDGSQVEIEVTATWGVPPETPFTTVPADGMPFVLRPPAIPGACPPPGRYLLRVGRPTEPGWRSSDVPLCIAPWIDPTGGPLLSAVAGLYTCKAVNVPATDAALRLGTVALQRRTSGTPAAGEWRLSGTTLTFAAPVGLAAGEYAVRMRVADVEADPSLWVVVP